MVLPKKHIKEMEKKVETSRRINLSLFIVSFLGSFFFLGALIHEIFHILVLGFFNCGSDKSWSFSFYQGLRASIQPLCSLDGIRLALFYISGYASVMISGIFSGVLGFLTDNNRLKYILTGTGTGLFISLISSLSIRGDISNSVQTLSLPGFSSILIYLVTAILATGFIFLIVYDLES